MKTGRTRSDVGDLTEEEEEKTMKIAKYHYSYLCCHSNLNDDYFESNEFNLQYKTD